MTFHKFMVTIFFGILISTTGAQARVVSGQCIPDSGNHMLKCSADENSRHVTQTFDHETQNVVANLKTVCENPKGFELSNVVMTEIKFDDGAKQVIFPLFVKRHISCKALHCPVESTLHFLAMQNGKITYASRQFSTTHGQGPQWIGKEGKKYGFTTLLSTDTSKLVSGSQTIKDSLCEGFQQAQKSPDFMMDTQPQSSSVINKSSPQQKPGTR